MTTSQVTQCHWSDLPAYRNSAPNAESALEDCQVQASCTAPISTIPVCSRANSEIVDPAIVLIRYECAKLRWTPAVSQRLQLHTLIQHNVTRAGRVFFASIRAAPVDESPTPQRRR
jgi:hypothetical protein